MAPADPILIQSSPVATRYSITPPDAAPKKTVSSSPQLPSPSTFIRPSTGKLKSGSEAQKALECKNTGFASAASLWDVQAIAGEYVSTKSTSKKTEKKAPAKKPRKRKAKSESIIINSDEPAQSAYFAPPKPAEEPLPADTAPPTLLDGAEKPVPAPRRRRSWTPTKDTVPYTLREAQTPTANSANLVPSAAPRVPLSELLGNFGYANNGSTTSPPPERTNTGEAITKRRRIELTDSSTVSVIARKQPTKALEATEMPPKAKKRLKAAEATELTPPKPKKRSKSPKKKAQTITALATAAYLPLKEPEPTQSTVSKFFTPTKADASTSEKATEQPAAEPAKAKKPRKPRKKPTEGSATTAGATKKAAGRPKKVKVTFNEKDHLPPLYSPEKANAQMLQQAFLFGTSSQLATDESPTFIREMQAAMRESEMMPGTQAASTSPTKRSCAKVPTAPHGTSLSVGQAEKEMWCSAARNFKGGLLRDDSGLRKAKTLNRPTPAAPVRKHVEPEPRSATPVPESAVPDVEPTDDTREDSGFVELVETPPKKQKHPEKAEPAKVAAPAPEPVDSFLQIDEISDSDSPATPSPPRRRASAPPSPVPPLALEITGSSTTIHLASGTTLKATDSQWQSILAQLFPHITATVKAAPPSTDPSKPSWHEKILLYDPIVLEDFTAYLNGCDLRVTVQRAKRKAATKGRKKKDATEKETSLIETVEEELQPWMVQKWCEEKSVCCLWKEGLRGGVRARY